MNLESADKALEFLSKGDSFLAIEYIENLDSPRAIAECFSQVIRTLYSQKQIDPMLALGRAGIQYCLHASRTSPKTEQFDPVSLRKSAQMMAYNLSANLWPGWEEPGVTLTPTHIAAGLDLAKLDVRLAHELQYPAKKVSNGYWLLGAQELAAREPQRALEAFERAQQLAAECDDTDHQHMIAGYVGIASVLLGKPEGTA